MYFVMCMSKQSFVIEPNSALVLCVAHFLLMTAVYSNRQRGSVNNAWIWESPETYVPFVLVYFQPAVNRRAQETKREGVLR